MKSANAADAKLGAEGLGWTAGFPPGQRLSQSKHSVLLKFSSMWIRTSTTQKTGVRCTGTQREAGLTG